MNECINHQSINHKSPTLYTVPKAPDPMMPPRLSSDSFTSLSLDRSGLASVGVRGCNRRSEFVERKTYSISTIKMGNISLNTFFRDHY